MSRRWTAEEDELLIRYAPEVPAGFIAEHDLGRSWDAGVKRFKHLQKTQADITLLQSLILGIEARLLAGTISRAADVDTAYSEISLYTSKVSERLAQWHGA